MEMFRDAYRSQMRRQEIRTEFLVETSNLLKDSIRCSWSKQQKLRMAVVVPLCAVMLVSMLSVVFAHTQLNVQQDPFADGPLPIDQGIQVNQTAESGNLRLTLCNYASDDKVMYMNFIAESIDGTPINDNLEFERIVNYGFEQSFIYTSSELGFFPYLTYIKQDMNFETNCVYLTVVMRLRQTLFYESGMGVSYLAPGTEFRLDLKNLEVQTNICEDIGFSYDNLQKLLEQIPPAGEEDFIVTGVYDRNELGEETPSYTIREGSAKVPFSEKMPEAYIDNWGFHDLRGERCLYLSIVPGSEENEKLLRSLSIYDNRTQRLYRRQLHYGYGLVWGDEEVLRKMQYEEGRVVVVFGQNSYMDFNCIFSDDSQPWQVDTFNDFDVFIGYGQNSKKIEDGKWSFDLAVPQIQYRQITQETPYIFQLDWWERTVESVRLTEYSLTVNYKDRKIADEKDWSRGYCQAVELLMKDGEKVLIGSISVYYEDEMEPKTSAYYATNTRIDLKNVAAVVIDGVEFPLTNPIVTVENTTSTVE